MKKLLIYLTLLTASSAFASVDFNNSTNGNLDRVESEIVQKTIVTLAINEYEGSRGSVEIYYSCTSTPMMKVFCSVSLVSEGGIIGAAALTFDRETKEASITAHVID